MPIGNAIPLRPTGVRISPGRPVEQVAGVGPAGVEVCRLVRQLGDVKQFVQRDAGPFFDVPREQFEILRIVALGLRDGHAMGGIPRQAEAVVVGHEAMVARAGLARWPGRHAGQRLAVRVATIHRHRPLVGLQITLHAHVARQRRLDQRRIAYQLLKLGHRGRRIEQRIEHVHILDTGERLLILIPRLASDDISHARQRHQVTLVGGVDERPGLETAPVGALDRRQPCALLRYRLDGVARQQPDIGRCQNLVKDLGAHVRLKIEGVIDAVFFADAMEDLGGKAPDRAIVTDVGMAQTAGHHPTDSGAVFQHNNGCARPFGCHGRRDARGRRPVDDDIGTRGLGLQGLRPCQRRGQGDQERENWK